MSNPISHTYSLWQKFVFWISWLTLTIPAFFIVYGVRILIMSVYHGYNDFAEATLLILMSTAIAEIILIGAHILTRYWQHKSYNFSKLLAWLSLAIIGLPLVTAGGCLFAYATLALQ